MPLGSAGEFPWISTLAKSDVGVVFAPFTSMFWPLTVSMKMMPFGNWLPALKVKLLTWEPE
jgi:hypothetical protein